MIIQTERLKLVELSLLDADFILELTNQPDWLKNIGDKKIHNIDDAEKYICSGPMASYKAHGFGLYLLKHKVTDRSIGLCGLLKRDELPHPDIGYAISQEYYHQGYATEAAQAVLQYSLHTLSLHNILAVTKQDNKASCRVLEKIGFSCNGLIELKGYAEASQLYILSNKASLTTLHNKSVNRTDPLNGK
jgi:[ribosomal protein S5]-alanine N-acetyltransferase